MFSLLTVAVLLWYLDRTSKQLHILTHSEVLDRDVLWMIRFLCHKHAKLWFGGWREQLWEISQGPGQVGHHVSSNARQCTIMKEDDSTASVAYLTPSRRSPAEPSRGGVYSRSKGREEAPMVSRGFLAGEWRHHPVNQPQPSPSPEDCPTRANTELYKTVVSLACSHFCFLPPFSPSPSLHVLSTESIQTWISLF